MHHSGLLPEKCDWNELVLRGENAILRAMEKFWETMGLLSAIIMPIWNIPLIVRIVQRKTSQDISLAWLFGVWGCMLLMLPSALKSSDATLKAFGISNVIFFSGVVVAVLAYRRGRPK